jgi:type III restriction enzyme
VTTIDNPILNKPYDEPDRHFVIGPYGPTGDVRHGRRESESWVPIAGITKGRAGADGSSIDVELDLDVTHERRERNSLINDLRREVGRWRCDGHYDGVTAITRKLLQHWAHEARENRVMFCQREAAETAIFLAEVAGRGRWPDFRKRIEPFNQTENAGLPRVALKMATGAGKTVVMAMLIAWQTLNKVYTPNDARFTNRFLVVTPGITIRDRLRVLRPDLPGNYYDERDLVPADLKSSLAEARIVTTNFHAFQAKDAKEIRGVARNTRLLLRAGRPGQQDPFKETPQAVVSRVLRDLGVSGRGPQVVVINDEAHHCYMDRSAEAGDKLEQDEKEANEQARVWFRGLQAVQRHVGIKQVFDFSATPYYLKGSGYAEGHIFGWAVGDFSLMDAIESGIVKVPRTPTDDDADHPLVTYLSLWDHVGKALPSRTPKDPQSWVMPPELEGALRSLHRSYQKAFTAWERTLRDQDQPPPVFIVVCNNTVVSRLVHDWIAGTAFEAADGSVRHRTGELPLLSNVVEGQPLDRPRTILVDSAQLESGEPIKADFKQAAAEQIAAFQSEYRLRKPGADAESITDEQLLREVMNTVGKKGRLGEQVRCVVSVSMLTEGWDANTVTHILGVRAFRSQLLCEQVVGRGLRRRSYEVNADDCFEPEYANVYGIPFQFISSDRPIVDPPVPRPAVEVRTVPGRERLRITFPKLLGYRVELPDERLDFDRAHASRFEVGPGTVPRKVELRGVVGAPELEAGDPTAYRTRQVAFVLAKQVLDSFLATTEDRRPWHFPRLAEISDEWLQHCVDLADGYSPAMLMNIAETRHKAAEAVWQSITWQAGNRRERLRPIIDHHDPTGHTGEVGFATRKRVIEASKSEVSHVTLDGKDGNTWEERLAGILERHRSVAAYVKNDHLGLSLPYVHAGRTHSYVPDFLVRLVPRDDGDVVRTLVCEVSGGQKSPGPTRAKATTARESWCVAVNNHGGFGRWGYTELTDNPDQFVERLDEAITLLYDDQPIVGDPEHLDVDDSLALRLARRSADGA